SYFDILNIDNGIMGYIEIPAIKVDLPIYHGESEEILTKGAAHLERTSFPIGGNSTHACISAHSGFPTQKFFDDIDELETGDTVTIKVLDRTLSYTVYDSEVVEPDDASKLQVISGEDILTLVTCYPYGINSHRLLVHARRTAADEGTAAPDTTAKPSVITESKTSGTEGLLLGSVVAATGLLAILGIVLLKRKKKARSEKFGDFR
ncbi:MAG: class C sortase, partial [Ruminococcus sp.]|nr:class C sortase [Ruminococcus sp.]